MAIKRAAFNPAVRAETDLHDCALRLARVQDGHQRFGLYVRLSALQAMLRREHHLRLAAAVFDPILRRFDAQLFGLSNGDLMLVTKDVPALELDNLTAKLRGMFADDPMVYSTGSDGIGFATMFDIKRNPSDFLGLCETILADALARHQTIHGPKIKPGARARDADKLTAQALASICEAFEAIEIGPFIRKQSVFAISRAGSVQRMFTDFTVSLPDLQRALAPGIDLMSERWLFRSLVRTIDQRVLAYLRTVDPAAIPASFGISLDVLGLDTESLNTLEAIVQRLSGKRIVICVPHLAAFADLGSYLAAGARLKAMNFSLCLDGLCHHTLPLINRTRLGADFLRMNWSPMLEQSGTPAAEPLMRGIERAEATRVILKDCDSPTAFNAGRTLGLALFQGKFLDQQAEGFIAAPRPAPRAAQR